MFFSIRSIAKAFDHQVNYRVLKGAASHFIAKTCLTDM